MLYRYTINNIIIRIENEDNNEKQDLVMSVTHSCVALHTRAYIFSLNLLIGAKREIGLVILKDFCLAANFATPRARMIKITILSRTYTNRKKKTVSRNKQPAFEKAVN